MNLPGLSRRFLDDGSLQSWREAMLEVARACEHEHEVAASFDRRIADGVSDEEAAPSALAEWGICVPEDDDGE